MIFLRAPLGLGVPVGRLFLLITHLYPSPLVVTAGVWKAVPSFECNHLTDS
jgi:hypothetical protein